MTTTAYPTTESFMMNDEGQNPSDGGFYNPYMNGYNGYGQGFDETTPEPNSTKQIKSNTNAETNPPVPKDSHNPDNIHDQHQFHRNHRHRHHHHHHHNHDHDHGHDHGHDHQHQHHHHDHSAKQQPLPLPPPPSFPEQPPYEEEPPPHFHEHIHRDHRHHHHHHNHNHNHNHNHDHDHDQHNHSLVPSALTIRRHHPGSTDPSLHSYQSNISFSPDYMYPPPQNMPPQPSGSNVRVTIRRNATAEHTVIQPVLYPVAIFSNSAPPQQPVREDPKPRRPRSRQRKPRTPIPRSPILPPPKPPTPKPRTPKPKLPIRTSPIPPVFQRKPSPVTLKLPIKLPVSPARTEPEPTPLPPGRKRSILVRKPIRTEYSTPTVRRIIKHTPVPPLPSARTSRVIVQQPANYNQHYRRQTVQSVPRRAVSYRSAPGLTTRELENDEMDDSGAPIYVQTPRVQTVTYRT